MLILPSWSNSSISFLVHTLEKYNGLVELLKLSPFKGYWSKCPFLIYQTLVGGQRVHVLCVRKQGGLGWAAIGNVGVQYLVRCLVITAHS